MTSLRPPPGPVDLTSIETDDAPGFAGKKAEGEAALTALGPELADLQERLFANRTTGAKRRVLLVLQGMDTSGKGGVLRHAVGLIDPQGVRITSFKAPTDEEKQHHFLWRIERALPAPGYVGVFDRSHYEDVLIVKVHAWADPATVEQRYDEINAFEARLVEDGCVVLKCMLHIGPDEQRERLQERLDDPEKHWKYNPGDLDERALWPAYREAYEIAVERTNTDVAPWHVVPADKKWFRNLAIAQLLLDALRGLDLQWPAADFDVAAEQRRLAEEGPIT
jgi:PPK2 family polyphosphate:nucleotide phosphotransferase